MKIPADIFALTALMAPAVALAPREHPITIEHVFSEAVLTDVPTHIEALAIVRHSFHDRLSADAFIEKIGTFVGVRVDYMCTERCRDGRSLWSVRITLPISTLATSPLYKILRYTTNIAPQNSRAPAHRAVYSPRTRPHELRVFYSSKI